MNSVNAFDAIGPAWERMTKMLFGPFNFEKWLTLGMLCFLQTCAGMGAQNGCNPGAFNVPSSLSNLGGSSDRDKGDESRFSPPEAAAPDSMYASLDPYDGYGEVEPPVEKSPDTSGLDGELAEVEHWVRSNLNLFVFLGIVILAMFIGFTVLFQWLGARAAFAYIDNLVGDRSEVDGPWKRHAALADSFWRWRLGYIALVWAVMLGLLVPIGLLVYRAFKATGPDAWLRLMTSGSLWILVGALVIAMLGAALIDVALFDVVLPIQYVRRTSTGPAVAEAAALIGSRFGAFLLYLVLKLLLAIGIAVAIVVVGFLTCCCGFLLMIIPVIGQALLQPVWVLHRSISLHFLGQFGPRYDVFAAPAAPLG